MLHWNTVTPLLKSSLETLMDADVFSSFRIVGGTSLSLQIGHRMSDDIDLFTDAPYDNIDFEEINIYLKATFPYVDRSNINLIGMGTSYFIGNNDHDAVKLDLFYTDTFIREVFEENRIRMATVEEIIAMKIDVVSRVGRKKDFWDLHELLGNYSLEQMLFLHEERYPYDHDPNLILKNFTDFGKADNDFEPTCLNGKYWEVIKLDLLEVLDDHNN
ncbi:MAG TPA: hypothetical protein DCO83_03690 [Mucilaginibacter sp.]|jgi:hypothetical protein|nr:hypothetical protein [Mucilaginibacter sp.]